MKTEPNSTDINPAFLSHDSYIIVHVQQKTNHLLKETVTPDRCVTTIGIPRLLSVSFDCHLRGQRGPFK